MEKDRIICILVCGGCDAIYFFVNGEMVQYIDHMADSPQAIYSILSKRTNSNEFVMVCMDMDFRSELAMRKFYARKNENGKLFLTREEEDMIIRADMHKLNETWENLDVKIPKKWYDEEDENE